MRPFFVSFCNLSAPGPALAVVDFASERLAWVDGPPGQAPWQGLDGLHRSSDGWWCLPQLRHGGISGLARFNADFEWEFCAPLELARDAHSLTAWEDGFLVNDTASNRLVHVRPNVAAGTVEERVFWSADSDPNDCVHLNSVAVHAGEIYVSMFGPRPVSGWQHSCQGSIYNVSRKSVVYEGLKHPHSLVTSGDRLYWLESGTGWLYAHDVAGDTRRIACVPGYVRGLAVSDDSWWIGVSGRRRRSRSTGVQLAAIDQADESASLWRVDRTTLQQERFSLAAYGVEIYDLLPCDAPSAAQRLADGAAAAAGQRAERVERELQRVRMELSEAVQGIRQRDQIAAVQVDQLNGLREELESAVNEAGSRELAGRLLERLLAREPDDPDLLYWHAICLRSQGQTDRALARFAEALAAGADEFWVRFHRGSLLLALGLIHQSIVDLRTAFRLEPLHAETVRLLQRAQEEQAALTRPQPPADATTDAVGSSAAQDATDSPELPIADPEINEAGAAEEPLAHRLSAVEQQVQGILHSRRWRMLSYLAQPRRALRALTRKAA